MTICLVYSASEEVGHRSRAITAGTILQDESTPDFLARVLEEMHQHSLYSENDAVNTGRALVSEGQL